MNYVVLGSFFGDEGKGQTVHNLCRNRNNPIVVRFSGGHQVGHTVRHGKLEHTFSNYGSGTLLGVPTYWSEYCTVDPITTMKELEDLNKMNIAPEIIYSPLCQVVTPFDVINQWNDEENLKHGTVGTGYKSTLDRVKNGYHLMVQDCLNIMVLRAKVTSIMLNYYNITSDLPMFNLDEWCVKTHEYFKSVEVCDISILNSYKERICEGSQGILLDQRFGIMPYCTPSNTTCQNAMSILNLLESEDYTDHVYVTRPYITRHGNGPIPTSKPVREVVDPNNKYNEFQKTLRAREFDAELLKHSLDIDSMFYNRLSYNHRRTLIVTHRDELNSEIAKEFEPLYDSFNSLAFSEYDKIMF